MLQCDRGLSLISGQGRSAFERDPFQVIMSLRAIFASAMLISAVEAVEWSSIEGRSRIKSQGWLAVKESSSFDPCIDNTSWLIHEKVPQSAHIFCPLKEEGQQLRVGNLVVKKQRPSTIVSGV